MSENPTVRGGDEGKPVKAGQDIAVVATFQDDIPANLMPVAGALNGRAVPTVRAGGGPSI